MELSKPASRRRHGEELKARVLAECNQPGASVAAVALANGLNANLVHRWRRLAEGKTAASSVMDCRVPAQFIPLAVEPAPAGAEIRIEVRRGATLVTVNWPQAAASQCAAWLGELLR